MRYDKGRSIVEESLSNISTHQGKGEAGSVVIGVGTELFVDRRDYPR